MNPADRKRLAAALGAPVRDVVPLGGGCIAAVYRVRLDDGRDLAVKIGAGLPLEARMLEDLSRHAPAPQVVHVSDAMLAMTYLPASPGLTPAAEEHLAGIVASLHAVAGARYGFPYDTVIGGLLQPNPPSADWIGFFGDQRLRFMASHAHAEGRIPADLVRRIDTLAGRLDQWIDRPAPPALIHGDLWGGNILAHGDRVVGLIDPALYYADPEVELAFMTLFHTVGDRFFAAYGERCRILRDAARPLHPLSPAGACASVRRPLRGRPGAYPRSPGCLITRRPDRSRLPACRGGPGLAPHSRTT